MPVWIPLLKASLPYLTQVVATAIPAFTAKTPNARAEEVIPRQIAELQGAATHSAEAVKALAEQLAKTIEGIDAGSTRVQKELQFLRRLALASLAVGAVGVGLAVWALSL
jgi:hypothetical protein